ncbi:macrocin-O-methyltransferase [Aureococcus anophagefferens]|nr:macrocin-O-methyltransferase [Aureococcus anophagefferens]
MAAPCDFDANATITLGIPDGHVFREPSHPPGCRKFHNISIASEGLGALPEGAELCLTMDVWADGVDVSYACSPAAAFACPRRARPADAAAALAGWGAEATPEAVAERLRRVGVDVDGGGAVLKRGWFDASFDWHASVLASLERFYDLVSDGGVVVLDDFGFWEARRVLRILREARRGAARGARRARPALVRQGRRHNRPRHWGLHGRGRGWARAARRVKVR